MSKITTSILYTLLATGLTNCAHHGATAHMDRNNKPASVNTNDQQETIVWTQKNIDNIQRYPISLLVINDSLKGSNINFDVNGKLLLCYASYFIKDKKKINKLLSWGGDVNGRGS